MMKVSKSKFVEFNDETRYLWKIEDILRDNNDKSWQTYSFIMDNGNQIVFMYNHGVIPEIKFDNNRMRFFEFMNSIDNQRISAICKANQDGQFDLIERL